MNPKYRWTHGRIAILISYWREGRDINSICEFIDATRSTVVSKAERLQLGPHPSTIKSAPPMQAETETENERPVRMPVVGFQQRRFAWEVA
jgi:hypothetical protein